MFASIIAAPFVMLAMASPAPVLAHSVHQAPLVTHSSAGAVQLMRVVQSVPVCGTVGPRSGGGVGPIVHCWDVQVGPHSGGR